MRRITYWLLGTLSALVLLFGYHTSTSGAGSATAASSAYVAGSSAGTTTAQSGSGSSASSGASSGSASGGNGSGGAGSGGGGGTTRTVTGAVAQTQWGPVQVQLSVSGDTITKVSVLQYPSGNPKDDEINSYALPILIKETTKAQNAHIDMVSGATVTSTGYLQSLQSALDQARL